MSSTSFSPLNWECPNCRQRYSQSTNLTFLRGTCQHDVCSDCIAQIVNRRNLVKRTVTRRSANRSLIEVSCPSCSCGKFHVERRANVKREQSNLEVIDLCDEEKSNNHVLDHKDPAVKGQVKVEQKTPERQKQNSVKKEEEEPTPNRVVTTKKEKSPNPVTYSTKQDSTKNMSPLPTTERSNLKPTFDVGDEVYAAWWDPKHDAERKGETLVYPGRIKSYKEIGHGEYGPTRLYNVKFDDGDQLDTLDDYLVFPKKDYLLRTRFDKMGWEPIGVKKRFYKKSSDRWARLVGWYGVVIDGHEQSFSLLSDAMKAHDSQVVRVNGKKTKKSFLNMPEDYPWLFEESYEERKEIKHELKEETDDDSRFSGDDPRFSDDNSSFSDNDSRSSEVEGESAEPPDNKRRRRNTPSSVDFWSAVADPIDFSRQAFMTKPLFHLNSAIHGGIKLQNLWFCPFIREGIATPGFASVPPAIADQVPTWSYEQIRDAINEKTYHGENVRTASQVAIWLKDVIVGSFITMRHEFPRCPFCPSRLKDNGKYIGPVYVIGIVTKKILPGSAEEQDIQDNRMSEFSKYDNNSNIFCLVEWRWMGMKVGLEETTKRYINAVCQPTLARMCQDPSKIYKSGATGESVRQNLWENATIPICSADFPDIFDYT